MKNIFAVLIFTLTSTSPCFAASGTDFDGEYRGHMVEAHGTCRLATRDQVARVQNGHFSMLWDSRHGILTEGELTGAGHATVETRDLYRATVDIQGIVMTITYDSDGCFQRIVLNKDGA